MSRNHEGQSSKTRRAYQSPKLTEYGDISTLTKGYRNPEGQMPIIPRHWGLATICLPSMLVCQGVLLWQGSRRSGYNCALTEVA